MAGNNKANHPVTVRGLIIPMDWDDQGNVIGVAISTSLEEEYRIELDRRGEELLGFVRERVKASGEVRLDAQGGKVLMVDTYQILE
jgi:5S rRNA maturation endonuclease (ribonuclease M5)